MKIHAPKLRTLAAVLAVCGAVVAAHAQVVEVKLNPDLKGRAQKAAFAQLKAFGAVNEVAGKMGVYELTTASASDAKRVASTLRESSAVLWAQAALPAVPERTVIPEVEYHHRMLAFVMKPGQDAKATVTRISNATGQNLTMRRVATGNRALVVLPVGASAATLAAVSVAAQSDASIAAVDRVQLMKHQWQPNDSLYSQQWALGNGLGGIRAPLAWDMTPSGNVAVAVIDTGIRPHPDLDGKYVPGYDMISNAFIAVDGDLRDGDPTDPGDADIDLDCSSPFDAYSSWHGTHVAGILAASSNNGEGIAGVAPNARIQSIRGLGRCGGTWEDIADSIRWAAGVPVPGVPINQNPVKVMNLSLGGTGPCNDNLQSAVDAAIARGATVVVAAGNDATLSSLFAPANCRGVISVGASNLLGDLSSYSNFGEGVTLSAPGGDFGNMPGVLSTLNGGGSQASVPSYATYSGTSMAAPHVAGVVALMLARDPSLTPGQILNRLRTSSRAFPAGTDCSGAGTACGSGLLDAANAVGAIAVNRGVNEVSGVRHRVHIVELVNSTNGRYVLSADPVEIHRMLGQGWSRTGQVFPTYDFATNLGDNSAIPQPVCRAKLYWHEAYRYTTNTGECLQYVDNNGMASDGVVFAAALPNANVCPSGSKAAWELARFNQSENRYNFRTLIDANEMVAMTSAGWQYSRVAFCVPN
jgi:subtilisin family serine protease